MELKAKRKEGKNNNIMLDVVLGRVTNVIDGDTFQLHVERIGRHNIYRYYDYETIRLADGNSGTIYTVAGQRAWKSLKSRIEGQYVQCKVRYRDAYNRLISDYEIIAPK